MIEIKAPQLYWREFGDRLIFLAGSIDMGKAVDWQSQVVEGLKDCNVKILNPRRADWDSTWEQSDTNALFAQQVDWELKGLEDADCIVYVFDPTGLAPITLMELGLHANTNQYNKRQYVVCPEGYWRRGNVRIVCQRYGLTLVESVETLIDILKELYN